MLLVTYLAHILPLYISAAVPLTPDKSCIPDAGEAPYRLSLGVYNQVYKDVNVAVKQLLSSGCTTEFLQTLSSCSEASSTKEVIQEAVSASHERCQEVVASSMGEVREFLTMNGCVDQGELSHYASTSATIFQLRKEALTISTSTTCSALIQASLRAFEDAIHAEVAEKSGHRGGAGPGSESPKFEHTNSQEKPGVPESEASGLWVAFGAGALAGLAVDLSLFPLDTIKTRLQSSAGFAASGGFKGLYQGIGSIALGSAPSSALFFIAYEYTGRTLAKHSTQGFMGHLIATTIGEIVSSLARVPADVVKSRQQVENAVVGPAARTTLWSAIAKVYEEGSRPNARSRFGAFYTGWLSSIVREIPFGCIQFPLFSYLKSLAGASSGPEGKLSMPLTALCGMVAGSVAGSLTTPLDVVKTRIMLAEKGEDGIMAVMAGVLQHEGMSGLFRGVVPRTLWISLGGAIFLGGYDGFSRALDAFYARA